MSNYPSGDDVEELPGFWPPLWFEADGKKIRLVQAVSIFFSGWVFRLGYSALNSLHLSPGMFGETGVLGSSKEILKTGIVLPGLIIIIASMIFVPIVYEMIQWIVYRLCGYKVTFGFGSFTWGAYSLESRTRTNSLIIAIAPSISLIMMISVGQLFLPTASALFLDIIAPAWVGFKGGKDFYLFGRLLTWPSETIVRENDPGKTWVYLPQPVGWEKHKVS